MSDPILTVKEAAQILRVHPETIRILLKSGQLVGYQIGNRWRVIETDLERYLAGHRNKQAVPA